MYDFDFFIFKINNQIEKLSGITMTPSGIESTSLLLAHGIGEFITLKLQVKGSSRSL